MSTKHTPGPWDHCCDSSKRVKHMRTACVVADLMGRIDKGNGLSVSTSIKVASGIKNWKDARLIAAAPELLSACKSAFDCLSFLRDEDRGDFPVVLEKLANAMQKAAGEPVALGHE